MPLMDKFQHILVILYEVCNFMVSVSMKTATAPETCNALMNNFKYFGNPIWMVCDQNPVFMSHLIQWFLHTYGIYVITQGPTNHQSLMAEHGIK